MNLRDATLADAELLFRWRNEPSSRRNSLDSKAIDYDEHLNWLSHRLQRRQDARIWILEVDGLPVGQIRYERIDDAAKISLSIDVDSRGKGLGTELLRLSAPLACDALSVREVYGLVKPDNAASVAAFLKAGFIGEKDSCQPASRFTWRRHSG